MPTLDALAAAEARSPNNGVTSRQGYLRFTFAEQLVTPSLAAAKARSWNGVASRHKDLPRFTTL